MEVLFVSHKFPPSTGGMENHCYQLVTGMEKKCKVHRLIFDNKGSKLLFFLTLSRKIRKTCKEHPGINIIYFNDALIAGFCSFMKLPERVSCVATLHGLDVVFPSKIYHKYIFSRLNFYSCIIAVSNATAKKAVSLGIKPGKIVVISNGVDITPPRDISTEAFQNWLSARQIDLAGRKLLIMMGRPVRRKGFTWFAEQVLPLLQDQFYLVIVGPFHQRATLSEKVIYLLPKGFRNKIMLLSGYFSDERQLRKVINNTANIKHLGRLPYPEIEMLLSKTDAFLMPNIPVDGDMEGFGLVCLEASAHGSLVFAANIDGIPDAIMDGKNGYLLPSEDSHAWVDKLIELPLNPDSFQQYRPVFSQYTIDNYSWTKMVCNYHMVFMNLSDSHR
jgi:phosphatidylinositol alpha-1,6-mannosyltransferase